MGLVNVAEQLDREITRIIAIPSASKRAVVATELAQLLTSTAKALAEVRTSAIRAMYEQGWNMTEIRRELGITRSRVEQIINS